MLLLAEVWNFTKSNTPSCVFFMFFKIEQMVPNNAKDLWKANKFLGALKKKTTEQLASVMAEITTF